MTRQCKFSGRLATYWSLLGLGVWLLLGAAAGRAAEPGLTDRAKAAAHDTAVAVEAAGQSAADAAKNFWHSESERIRNRTADEIVAWVIMGLLVGGMAGVFTKLKATGWGAAGRLALGLAGAFLGGIVVHVTRLDFGWGPVLIRYEELAMALVGAVLLILGNRLIRSRSRKPSSNS